MTLALSTATRHVYLVVFAAALCLGGLAAYLFSKHQSAEAMLAEVEPRYARLIGLQARAPDLDKALIDRKALLARHAYSATQDVARAGSDAQQRAREAFVSAGLVVSSTQLLPAKTMDGFDRIPVVLRLEGDYAAVQNALAGLGAQSPTLFIDGFNVQTVGMPTAEGSRRLNIQVNLFVLRVRA